MNGVEDEQSVDECIQNATSAEDSKRLLRQRDDKWKKQVSEKLVENFNDKKNIIDSKNEKQKPASLLKRALNALAEIDESTLSTASDLDVVRARISEILDRMKVLSDAVNG
jgi:DNA repair ATPase RecN